MSTDDVIPADVLSKIRAMPPMQCEKCGKQMFIEDIRKIGNLIAIKYKDGGYESDLRGFYCSSCASALRHKPTFVNP
jgi:predicted nucleic acid-binding Zn ribbon protein